jgi:hypothetical protein
MHIAIYDAMVAAWDSKYTYKRPRPNEVKADLSTVMANPLSPSYPAEHAVAAGAASEVLAYAFPDRAAFFREKAEDAARSRVTAGVNYPSDVAAGLALGRQVAALVIARAKSDGTDAKWTGSVPVGPGKWTGTNPILPLAGTWKPWVLSSPREFRPAPPIAYDSPAKAAELAELKNFPRTPQTNNEALFWEAAVGGLRAQKDTGIPARRQPAAGRTRFRRLAGARGRIKKQPTTNWTKQESGRCGSSPPSLSFKRQV